MGRLLKNVVVTLQISAAGVNECFPSVPERSYSSFLLCALLRYVKPVNNEIRLRGRTCLSVFLREILHPPSNSRLLTSFADCRSFHVSASGV